MQQFDVPDPDSSVLTIGWRAILDAIPALVYALKPDGSVTFANRYFYQYTGQPEGAGLANTWPAVIHPDDLPNAAASLAAGLAGTTRFKVRQRIRAADGTYKSFEAHTAPYHDAAGRIVQWFGVETDVDDLLDVIAQLQDAQRGLRSVLESIPQIVWTADATGWIDWYNSKWYEFTGQTVEQAAGWGWQEAHHPVDFPLVMEGWPKSITTGEPFEMEFRLRRHDAVFRWMLTRVVPVRNDAGTVVRWYGSNTDIEDRKQAEQRSRRVASLVQEALLPDRLPNVAGLCIDGLYLAAESDALVGGDWYDAVVLDTNRILVSCGDVTGHGLEAAAFASRLRQMIAFAGREDSDPATVLRRVNAVMVAENAPFATAATAVIDLRRSTVRVALAGHPPPIVAHPALGAYPLEPDGMPLGVMAPLTVETREIELPLNAVFLLYTDGIAEFARDLLAAQLALERAATMLAANPGMREPARFVKETVLGSAQPRDDIAILVVQRTPLGASVGTPHVPLTKAWRFHSSHSMSAHNARIEVGTYLASLGADREALADAELVVGELLANTVEHAPGLVEVVVDWTGARPTLLVRDAGRGTSLPQPVLPDALSEDGRGLFLVYAFAEDVLVTGVPTVGTEVSCRLRLTRAGGVPNATAHDS